jgi:hypothetical protein
MRRPSPPDWTLITGIALEWPDGQRTVVSQCAWRPSESGWTCSVALRGTSLLWSAVVALDVHLSDQAVSRETAVPDLWIRIRDLVTERLRNRAADDVLAAHLGEVIIR